MLEICSTKNPIHHFTKKGYMEQYSGALRYVDTCKPLQISIFFDHNRKKKQLYVEMRWLNKQHFLSFYSALKPYLKFELFSSLNWHIT